MNKEVRKQLEEYHSLLKRRGEILEQLLEISNQIIEKKSELFQKDSVFNSFKSVRDKLLYLEAFLKSYLKSQNNLKKELYKIDAELAFFERYFDFFLSKPTHLKSPSFNPSEEEI